MPPRDRERLRLRTRAGRPLLRARAASLAAASWIFAFCFATCSVDGPELVACGDESSISNFSSSETSSSSSRMPSSSSSSSFIPLSTISTRCLLLLGLAGPSSTTTNDFWRSRSFHLRVREIAWNQSVDCLSAQTVGKGYFDAVTLI